MLLAPQEGRVCIERNPKGNLREMLDNRSVLVPEQRQRNSYVDNYKIATRPVNSDFPIG